MNSFSRLLPYLTWPVALGLAIWILRQLPLGDALASISGLSLLDYLLWAVLNICIILLLVGRWFILTRAMSLPLSLLQLLRVRQGGQLISFVTPGPQFGGEPLQVYWLWNHYAVPGPSAFLAVGLDRFYEFGVNFAILLLAVTVLLVANSVSAVNWLLVALVLLGLVLVMGLFMWILLRRPAAPARWIGKITQRWRHDARLQRLQSHWELINAELKMLVATHKTAMTTALVLSLLAWLGMIVEFWLLLRFLDVPIDGLSFVFLFTLLRLAFLLPFPGGVGGVEAAMLWAFQLLALPLSAAAALIVLMRLRDVLILLAGALMLPGLRRPNAGAGDTAT